MSQKQIEKEKEPRTTWAMLIPSNPFSYFFLQPLTTNHLTFLLTHRPFPSVKSGTEETKQRTSQFFVWKLQEQPAAASPPTTQLPSPPQIELPNDP